MVLDLSYNPGLTYRSYELLSEVFQSRSYLPLKELNLEGNKMGNKNAILLMNALAYTNKLTYLNLCRNDLGDPIVQAVYTLLELNNVLLSLLLGWNLITSKGVRIVEGLMVNQTL